MTPRVRVALGPAAGMKAWAAAAKERTTRESTRIFCSCWLLGVWGEGGVSACVQDDEWTVWGRRKETHDPRASKTLPTTQAKQKHTAGYALTFLRGREREAACVLGSGLDRSVSSRNLASVAVSPTGNPFLPWPTTSPRARPRQERDLGRCLTVRLGQEVHMDGRLGVLGRGARGPRRENKKGGKEAWARPICVASSFPPPHTAHHPPTQTTHTGQGCSPPSPPPRRGPCGVRRSGPSCSPRPGGGSRTRCLTRRPRPSMTSRTVRLYRVGIGWAGGKIVGGSERGGFFFFACLCSVCHPRSPPHPTYQPK